MSLRSLLLTLPLLATLACSRSPDAKSATSVTSGDPIVRAEAQARLADAAALVTRFKQAPRPTLAARARCVVVVPNMLKGGLLIGARQGEGFAVCRTSTGWGAPAPVTVSGASFGPQVGVESVDVVMVIVTDAGRDSLARARLTLGADASVAAGPVGRGRQADTDTKLKAEILSYSWSRGLFAGAELNGAVISEDSDATRALYGYAPPEFRELVGGNVPVPSPAQHFVDTVKDAFASE